MAKFKNVQYWNFLYGAILFWVDYRTGIFSAGFILLIAVVVFLIKALRANDDRSAAFAHCTMYALWFATSIIVGVVSSRSVEKESQRVALLAEGFRSTHGQFPSSLKSIMNKEDLDDRSRLRIGSSTLSLHGEKIIYSVFPGRFVTYDLKSKRSSMIVD